MKHLLSIILACMFVPAFLQGQTFPLQNRNLFWFEEPAKNAKYALPLGCQQLTASVYGAPGTEQICLKSVDGQYLGSLRISTLGHEMYSNYRHALDLDSAKDVVEYMVPSQPGVTGVQTYFRYRRESFCPMGSNLLVMRLTTDSPKGISFVAQLFKPQDGGETAVSNVESFIKVVVKEGQQMERDGGIYISGAHEVILYFDMSGKDEGLAATMQKGFETLLSEHVSQYQAEANKSTLWLGEDPKANRPANVHRSKAEERPWMALLYRLDGYVSTFHIANYLKDPLAMRNDILSEILIVEEGVIRLPQLQSLGRYTTSVGDLHLDMEWQEGKITRLAVTSAKTGTYRFCSASPLKGKGLKQVGKPTSDKPDYQYDLKIKAGATSVLTASTR